MESRARRSWPMFASYEEDLCLRKEKWNSKYGEANHSGVKRRPIFWDMTGIRAYQFGAADTKFILAASIIAATCSMAASLLDVVAG